MINITFLGTAGDSLVVGSQERASGGIIIKTDSEQFHIDPGPGSLVRAKEYGVNLRENSAVIVTNPTILRCNDMSAVVLAMTHDGLDKQGILFVHHELHDKNNDFYRYLTRVAPVRAGTKEFVKNSELLFTQTTTAGTGVKLFLDKVIGYLCDTDYSKEVADKFQGCDVLLLCCNPEEAMKFLKQIRPKLGVLAGFGVKSASPKEIAKKVQARSGVKVIGAEDGLTLDLGVDKGQKHLDSFLRGKTQKKARR